MRFIPQARRRTQHPRHRLLARGLHTLPDVPLVIVLSPSAGEEVKSGFIASGCSRTVTSQAIIFL